MTSAVTNIQSPTAIGKKKPPAIKPTKAEQMILMYIHGFMAQNGGLAPTIRELVKVSGRAYGPVEKAIYGLEDKGWITRNYKQARSIKLWFQG